MMARDKQSGSAVRRAADEFRQMILSHSDGAFLGSENDLVAKFGISRPTFRQAAKLVEQEQLVLIKRGVRGGFFARLPSSTAVAHVAAVYLHARKATVEDAIRSAKPIFAETARTAARIADPASSARLADFMANDANPPADFKSFLRSEREFLQIFAAASGNPVLELYAMVLVDFASSFVAASVFSKNADRVEQYRPVRNGLIQAILNGDEQLAELLSHRRSQLIIGWMQTDMAPIKKASPSSRRRKGADRQLIQSSHQSAATDLAKTSAS